MPGSPATSPNFGAPRWAQTDDADFSDQVNGVTDVFDAKAVLINDARLSDVRTPADGSVTAAKLAAGSVTAAALGTGAVTAAALAAGAVGTAALADQSITDVKIQNQGIQTDSYAIGSVTTAVLADGAVTSGKLSAALAPAVNLPGDLIISASSTRAGCLLCDGSAVSRTQYGALFAAIGSSYGPGDGSTTFALPDYRQRVIVGAGAATGDTARPSARQVGQVGGEEAHTLSLAESPSHAHTINGAGTGCWLSDPGHSHTIPWQVYNNSGGTLAYRAATVASGGWPVDYAQGIATTGVGTGIAFEDPGHAHSMGGAGGSGPHNNMSPFGVANVFIKT